MSTVNKDVYIYNIRLSRSRETASRDGQRSDPVDPSCIKYEKRMAKLSLLTLELRRLHIDLIFCYKIVFGIVSVNLMTFSHSVL